MNNIDLLKQKYKKDWDYFKNIDNGEKLFLEFVKAKEKILKVKQKTKAIQEKERKREARALIILAKLLIELEPDLIKKVLIENNDKFIQKEGRKEIDYSKYIYKLINDTWYIKSNSAIKNNALSLNYATKLKLFKFCE